MLQFDGFCEKGNRSGINQDVIGMFSDGHRGLFLVSDGIGGHYRGETASYALLDACANWWKCYLNSPDDGLVRTVRELKDLLSAINRKVFESTDSVCGATVVLLFLNGSEYSLMWSGDSRCYMGKRKLFGTEITQMTRDDTWENQVYFNGTVTEEQIRHHANYGKLTRAIGINQECLCNIYTGKLNHSAVFALCSDGVYKYAGDALERSIKQGMKCIPLQKSLYQLRTEVYKNGAPDNMSCILIRITI